VGKGHAKAGSRRNLLFIAVSSCVTCVRRTVYRIVGYSLFCGSAYRRLDNVPLKLNDIEHSERSMALQLHVFGVCQI